MIWLAANLRRLNPAARTHELMRAALNRVFGTGRPQFWGARSLRRIVPTLLSFAIVGFYSVSNAAGFSVVGAVVAIAFRVRKHAR